MYKMGHSVRDYLVTVEWVGNRYIGDIEKRYEIFLVRGCATLNELNAKIYEKCRMQKSKWEITKIEKLKKNVTIVD